MTVRNGFGLKLAPFTRLLAGVRTPLPRTGQRAKQRRARRAVLSFVVAFLAVNALVLLALYQPRVRDPEYGRRVASLRQRIAENPGRPLVVVIGSSRSAMGINPAEWEAVRPNKPGQPDPLLFNLSLLGSGPVMELMALRRMYADGVRPSLVLIEFWPPFLHTDNGWDESFRVAVDRLLDVDTAVVRDYFPDSERIAREMRWRRTSPIFANRERLLVQLLPRWLPGEKRVNWSWDQVDGWGWKAGSPLPAELSEERTRQHRQTAQIYGPLLASHRVSAIPLRAMREAVALAREYGSAVGFLFMPESSEFRQLYPEAVDRICREQLAQLGTELQVPVIDTRDAMKDVYIADGYHLSRIGSAEFTRKVVPTVSAAFPQLKVSP